MAIGSSLSDFVGYSAGIPQSTTPTTGYVGLLDFTGIPVGVPNIPPPAGVGFVGLLDFVGFRVGVSSFVPPTPPQPFSFGTGGAVLDDRDRRKRKREDEEILILT